MIEPSSPCILWAGKIGKHGYGLKSRNRLAHRLAWQSAYGPILKGLHLHHKCGVRHCVNVLHLELLTEKEHAETHNNPAKWTTDPNYGRN